MKYIDIEKIANELRKMVEKEYTSYCNDPERDDDGEWIKPSLSSVITLVLDKYFEENYEEIPSDKEEEFSNIYNELENILESSLNEKAIKESIIASKENYKGLTNYERNNGKY